MCAILANIRFYAKVRIGALAAIVFYSITARAMQPADYSKEAMVIENMTTKVSFTSDGARDWLQTFSVRVQSEGAVRQFGVLAFSYASDSEEITIDYVRVKKPDGSIVETPQSSVQDLATPVATVAPTYSDLRQKQIPVKALGVGDLLEYSVHSVQRKPEVAGQFWYTEFFIKDGVVLNEVLEIRVPKDKYVQVSSPKIKPETNDETTERVYTWKHSQLKPSKPPDKNKAADEEEPLKAQLTTFRNWEEVGDWWAALARPQAVVTSELQAKAKELTAGLTSDVDKEKAIYKYVAMKFRYISISLGAGKYRPHSAAEVYTNQYGDCKDKHTLFVAMLKAAGIDAWPALIGAGIKFDESAPSPAQFNHVITVIPQGGTYVWLDTTAEVAPFGLLSQGIRDEQALVIPMNADNKPKLVKTPLDPPFQSDQTVNVKASLAADGTLTGHFDFEFTGDEALGMRTGFRQLAPAQWQTATQQFAYALGYAGDVSAVDVENVEDTDKPFRLSYDYTRKNYSDWEHHQITPPIPPLGFGPGEEADKPKEPFWGGARGAFVYSASLKLPKGFTPQVPQDATASSPFADYSGHCSAKDGTLTCERKLTIKQAKVSLEEWADYQKFSKTLRTDQNQFTVLAESGATLAQDSSFNPEAEQILKKAGEAAQSQRWNEARDLLKQAEQINPKQPGLWSLASFLDMVSHNSEQAIADARKELELHPQETVAAGQLAAILARFGRANEAIDVWRNVLKAKPDDPIAAANLARLLSSAKRYAEIPPILEKPIAAAPDRYDLRAARVLALLRIGQKDAGITEAKEIVAANSTPQVLNELAYALAEADSDLTSAQAWAEKAVNQTEQDCAKTSLASLEQKDLQNVNMLGAEWDTVGWVYFKQKDLAKAEKYIAAAWNLMQRAEIGDHLGQIYELQGKREAAIHLWRLALAADAKDEDVKERLRKAGVSVNEALPYRNKQAKFAMRPEEELGKLRTMKVPGLSATKGSAELFVLFSKDGIEDSQFISGDDELKSSSDAIRESKPDVAFPDDGPEKIGRRGILSCSQYTTPNCNLTFLLPSTTTFSPVASPSDGEVAPPSLVSKIEPDYSEEARKAKVEGTVLLSLIVDESGVPQRITVVKALGFGLDEKAVECVSKWRFKPGTKGGTPVATSAQVEVNFRLVDKPE